MPTVEVTVSVKVDGVSVTGFPMTRRVSVTEVQAFDYQKSASATYTAIPTEAIDSLKALIVTSDKAVTVRLDAQSDAGIEVNADVVLIVLDGTINAGASTNATVSNASGSIAAVRGVGAG